MPSTNESVWSSGMIPASGAGGPEFESRVGPSLLDRFGALTNRLSTIRSLFDTSSFGRMGLMRVYQGAARTCREVGSTNTRGADFRELGTLKPRSKPSLGPCPTSGASPGTS